MKIKIAFSSNLLSSFFLIGISFIMFHSCMQILGTILRPVIWTTHLLFNVGYLVVHGVAVRLFTSIHQFFLMGQKAREISEISQLIEWLEEKNPSFDVQKNIQKTLYRFCKSHHFNTEPEASCLLEALKVHRYSLRALWGGVSNNSELLHQMHGYLKSNHKFLPSDSPYKNSRTQESRRPDTRVVRELNFSESKD